MLTADLEQPVENLLGYAFGRILTCAPAHRPWSLAELSLVEDDLEWLKALCERTTASNLRRALSGPSRFKDYSRDAQLGAVLLLLESELARRHASEGMLWAAIHQQVVWRGDASRFLFNHRQPNARHKTCLEAAAKELGLRCAFGEDSAQEWYQSVFLQCGFSKKSFEGRLPQWLAGENTPVSVARLLSNDVRYSSSSFNALWTALREYRHGSLDRHGLKVILESSPWVLREWHDSLMELSRGESHSSIGESAQSDVPVPAEKLFAAAGSDETISDRRFLSEPRLRWSNGALQFVSSLELSDSLELEDDADIVIGGQVRSRLIMQADGSFDATPNEIELPTTSPSVVVELRSLSAVAIATQTLTIWDDVDDVDGYVVRTGRRIDPWSREFSQRETLLIYSADLRIEQPARRERGVADRFGLEAESRAAREQPVVGIALRAVRRDARGLAVGRGRDEQFQKTLRVPLAAHKFAGEPVEQFGVRRQFALRTEFLARPHDTGAEDRLPKAIRGHARRQRIALVHQPLRQRQPVHRRAFGQRIELSGHALGHLVAE